VRLVAERITARDHPWPALDLPLRGACLSEGQQHQPAPTSTRIGYTAYTPLHNRHIQAIHTQGKDTSTSAPGHWRLDTRWRNTSQIDLGSSSCAPPSRHDTSAKEPSDCIPYTGRNHTCASYTSIVCDSLLVDAREASPAKPANHLRLTTREDIPRESASKTPRRRKEVL
jgi:hypothetical protein